METNLDLISLRVKCPVCGHSLMDESRMVDNCPSIKLKIAVGDREGFIHMSSVYESYNYLCSIECPEGEEIKLYCPQCSSQIKSSADCEICKSHMISLDLELGGSVSICSRIGCENHFVKFVDFSFALKQFYIDESYKGRPFVEDMTTALAAKKPLNEEEEKVEIIKTGTFLQTYCPHCKKSLHENGSIKLHIHRGEERGHLILSPYLNVFNSKTTIRIPEDEFIGDLYCWHCHKPLLVEGGKCEECGSEIARLIVSASKRLVDFHICAKKGCRWHGLSKEDLNDIRLQDSLEW
jgi:ssDNA-binding Zn-finger/Zn-ribbon topoisomerase 1